MTALPVESLHELLFPGASQTDVWQGFEALS